MRFLVLALSLSAILMSTQICSAQQRGLPNGTTFGVPNTDQMFDGDQHISKRPRFSKKMGALLRLRDEGLKLREEDGGMLTEEHRAYLQSKLDAIQAKWPAPSSDPN